MFSPSAFRTSSLLRLPAGDAISRILAAAVNAVEPGEAVRRFVSREADRLTVAGRVYDLTGFRSVRLLGLGKASVAMAGAVADILGNALTSGLVIPKHEPLTNSYSRITVFPGDHPVPGEHSLEAGRKAVEFVSGLGADDLLFCLISGGGSALVTAPVEGVSLPDLQALTNALLACGARVDEINTLRRRLDRVKGGGVARLANGATIVSLILSDVVGSLLEAIASGPTVPDPSTREDALAIVGKYGLQDKLSTHILSALGGGDAVSSGNPFFEKVQNVIVGSNLLAAQAALTCAEGEGFHPYLLRTDLQGEARTTAFELATALRQAHRSGDPVPGPACIVAGGETTVTLRQGSGQVLSGSGRGGRNTELALAAVRELVDYPGVALVTLATDGEDGPTDAAGAVVTGETFRRAHELGLDPEDFLARNDSYSFFEKLGDLLKPGPTGTNVNDLTFLFIL